jgi:hypothetical protein
MEIVQQILFILLTGITIFVFAKKVKEITANINLGRDEDISGNRKERWRNVLLLALGQKKNVSLPSRGHYALRNLRRLHYHQY